LFLLQGKLFNGVGYAVFGVAQGDELSGVFDAVGGVGHRHAGPGGRDHGNVVGSVAEGGGLPCLAHLTFTKYPLELKTLYTVLMLKRGFLGNVAFYPTLAHTPEMMAKYEEAIDAVFAEMRSVLDKEDYDALVEAIGGPVCQSGFKRLIN